MAASFPAAQKNFAQQTDDVSDADAADVNAIYDEVEAIEGHLGAGSIAAGQILLNSAAGADPWLQLQIDSVEKFRIGVDDSDSDKFKIHTGALADPSYFEMSSTGAIELTNAAETASDPGRHLYLQRTHTGTVGAGKGLTGVEVRSTFNGSADALTSEVKGGEFKARHTTGNTYHVGTFKGVIGNVDCKNGTVTTGWAVEGAIDVSSGGTFTTAACFHGNLNNSGTVTNSYGVYVHGLSGNVLTRGLYVDYATTGIYLDNCTTDIRLHNGATLVNAADDGGTLTITEDNIVLVGGGWGKIAFGGYTDWGTGATGTDITGNGYDWVTSTVGHVDSGLLATAIAAAYHAMTVTVSQTTSTSVFGTWTELYFKNSVDLGGSNNYASVWGQMEGGTSVTSPDTGMFMAAFYGNVKMGATLTIASGVAVNGFRAQAEISAVTNNGRLAAFECLKSGGADWEYGLYIADCATGVDITACTTAGINIVTGQVTGINIAGTCSTAGISMGGLDSGDQAMLVTWSGTPSESTAADAAIVSVTGTSSAAGDSGDQLIGYYAKVVTSTGDQANNWLVGYDAYVESQHNVDRLLGVRIYTKFNDSGGTIDTGSAAVYAICDVAQPVTVSAGPLSCIWARWAGDSAVTTATTSCFFGDIDDDIARGLTFEVATGKTCTTGIELGVAGTGAYTTGIDFAGTYTHPIKMGSATVTVDAGRANAFFSIGTYAAQKTVSLTDNYLLLQINVSNDTNPGSAKKLDCIYLKAETGAAQGNARLKGLESYIVVGHALHDAHAIYGEVYYTGSTTGIDNEGFGGAFTVDTTGASGTPTGLLYGMKARIKGDNLNTGGFAHCAAFLVTESSTFTNTRFTNLSGATITNMIDSNQAGTCTNFIALSGAFTNLWNFDAASGFITSGGTDCTASGATDPTYTAKVITPDGNAGYIRIWAAA